MPRIWDQEEDCNIYTGKMKKRKKKGVILFLSESIERSEGNDDTENKGISEESTNGINLPHNI